MKKGIIAVIAILILLMIAVLIWNANQKANPIVDNDGVGVIDDDSNDTTDDDETPAEIADPSHDTTDGTGIDDVPEVSEAANVKVTLPDDGQKVGVTGLVIVGEARVHENSVMWRVKDASGAVLASGSAAASAADIGQFGPFVAYANYSTTAGQTGVVETYAISARDGSEIELVSVPVRFVAERPIDVYFGSAVSAGECDDVKSVTRFIPAGVSRRYMLESAVWALLEGVTREESASNYATSIADNVRVNSLKIVDDVVYLDVSGEIERGGSCRVAAIRAQISELLAQFSDIDEVVISVDGGSPEEALQP